MSGLRNTLRELFRYPSAVVGIIILLLLVALSVYAVVKIPYSQAVRLWRGGENIWYKNPKYAPPVWVNFFRKDKQPVSMVINSADGKANKVVTTDKQGNPSIVITYTIPFQYDGFPTDMAVYFTAKYNQKQPFVSMAWLKPDGTRVRIADFATDYSESYWFSQDTKLQRRLAGLLPQQALFVPDPKAGITPPEKGTYKLQVQVATFEPNSDVNGEFILYGKVSGLAGTDHLRRDLGVALLWGTPVALAFGLVAALGTTLSTMLISATAVWFGGWVDALIQRITGVNYVLPFLPILIMIGTFYSRSIITILGATIILSIFGPAILTYRAIFLQVKQSPYIEAARAYGAGSWRVIFQYLLPRIVPLLVPQLVVQVPVFVFLEASLAVLGLGDPVMPTWGKMINDAQQNGALYQGLYYWVLEPAGLLMVAGLAFALLGFSLDRIFNPRLRGL